MTKVKALDSTLVFAFRALRNYIPAHDVHLNPLIQPCGCRHRINPYHKAKAGPKCLSLSTSVLPQGLKDGPMSDSCHTVTICMSMGVLE